MPNDAQPNRKHFWWMILTVLLFCSIPLMIAMVPQENRVAWRLQSEGCKVRYGNVNGGFWMFHPIGIHGDGRINLTNETLELFPKMPHIKDVNFKGADFGGLDLTPLAKMPKLTEVVLFDCRNLSSENLQKLEKCSKLDFLYLYKTHITREDIQTWEKCPLTGLGVMDAALSNDELEEIAKISLLSLLYINGNPGITDEGLEHLLKLEHLEALQLIRTGVTQEGIENFRKKHPNAKLEITSDF